MKNGFRLFASAGLALRMTTAVAAAPDKSLNTIPRSGIIENITFENTGASPRTFTYKAGSRPGQVILSIGAGC